ncbi:MAG: DUF2807 domain-containing protein [Bacteroidaceae bacterium]|nr:DUF2807 domain-containing protein [Bacteroidaceae bacterium]
MNYRTILTIAAMTVMASCNNGNSTKDTSSDSSSQTAESPQKRSTNIIRRPISIPSTFSYITNIGSVDINFSFGDYSIDVEGDSATLKYLSTDFDSNLLTIGLLSEDNTDINKFSNGTKITMYISAPELQCVSICGTGNFVTEGTWKGDNIQLGLLGKGTMTFDSIECNSLSLQTTDKGSAIFSSVKADDITLYTRSNATINANIDAQNLTVINDGKPTITINGRATNYKVKNPNDNNLHLVMEKK